MTQKSIIFIWLVAEPNYSCSKGLYIIIIFFKKAHLIKIVNNISHSIPLLSFELAGKNKLSTWERFLFNAHQYIILLG